MAAAALSIVLNKDKTQVLLVKRQDIPLWVLPGGGIDKGETPDQAALRETLEETGITVKITRKVGTYVPLNKLASMTYTFLCEPVSGVPSIGAESKDVAFFELEKLPSTFFFVHYDWLQDALKKENQTIVLQKTINQVTYFNLMIYFIKHPWIVLRFLLTRLGVK